jgi:hypothetical protein
VQHNKPFQEQQILIADPIGLRATLLYPGQDAPGADRRLWIERLEARENNCDIEADTGHVSTGVKIVLQVSRGIFID